MNMVKKEKKVEDKNYQNYTTEYAKIFSILGIDMNNLRHEWNKEGDFIKEFNLYEEHPRPILTPNTYSIDC